MRNEIKEKHEEIMRMAGDPTVTDEEFYRAMDELFAMNPTAEERDIISEEVTQVLMNLMSED